MLAARLALDPVGSSLMRENSDFYPHGGSFQLLIQGEDPYDLLRMADVLNQAGTQTGDFACCTLSPLLVFLLDVIIFSVASD